MQPSYTLQLDRLKIIDGNRRYVVVRGEIPDVVHLEFKFGEPSLFGSVAIPVFAIRDFLERIGMLA